MNGASDIAAPAAWTPPAERESTVATAVATAGAIVIACVFLSHWPGYNYLILGGSTPFRYYVLPGFVALFIALMRPAAPLRPLI